MDFWQFQEESEWHIERFQQITKQESERQNVQKMTLLAFGSLLAKHEHYSVIGLIPVRNQGRKHN